MNLIKKSWLQKYLNKYNYNQSPIKPPFIEETNNIKYKITEEVNIYASPNTNEIIGILPKDSVVGLIDVGGTNSWIKTSVGWIPKTVNGKNYLILN